MPRRSLLAGAAVAAVLVGAAVVFWPRPAAPPSRPGLQAGSAGDNGSAPVDERQRARAQWGQMVTALQQQVRSTQRVVPSGPERRPGEPDALFEERQRALAEYEKFVHSFPVAAEREAALRQLFADAQENWRSALKAAGRTQPLAPGSEMSDPVLSSIVATMDEEFRRGAREALPDDQAMMFQSFVPTVLPFVRTQAFDVRDVK